MSSKKLIVYAVGGEEENPNVIFTDNISAAHEIWVYEPGPGDLDAPMLMDEEEYLKSMGKPVHKRPCTVSFLSGQYEGVAAYCTAVSAPIKIRVVPKRRKRL